MKKLTMNTLFTRVRRMLQTKCCKQKFICDITPHLFGKESNFQETNKIVINH